METTVLAELMFEVVPHWSGRIEKYIQETEDLQEQSSGIIITPSGVVDTPKIVVPDRDGSSSTRRIISTPGVVTTPGIAGVAMPPPSLTTLTPGGAEPSDTKNAAQFKKALAAAHGTCKLDSKPDSKARFSSLTSPVVMYDGESQHMLCDMWTALNNKRGGLRKEMMAVKRRQQLALLPPPRAMPEIAMDSDEGEGSDKDDDEDMEHSAEMLRLRLRMEREKMKRMNRRGPPGMAMGGDSLPGMGGLQFKRARMIGGSPGAAPPTPPRSQQGEPSGPSAEDDEKMKVLLEAIDEDLDKVCKVTETVAFIWLKGDPYDGHLKFILGRLKDVSETIGKSGFVPPKAENKQSEEKATSQVTLVAMAPPLPQTPPTTAGTMSPKFEISKKKSDLTMRDAPSIRPSQVVPPMEKQVERKKSTSSSEDTVEPSMESVKPPPLLLREVVEESGKTNPFEGEVLEVDDDDDEGIVC